MTSMLYVQDLGWMGCLVVVAFSEDEARLIMLSDGKGAYLPERDVISYELWTVGLKHICWGDS